MARHMQYHRASSHGESIRSWLRALRSINVRLAPEILAEFHGAAAGQWDVSWHGERSSRYFDIREFATGRQQAFIACAKDPLSIVRLRQGITDFILDEDFTDGE